jgi:teichuronic acid biosynthesis glycosyltransferase TuaG
VDEQSNVINKVIQCHPKYDYELLLRECFGNSTVIYNAEKLGKIYGENIRKRNDFAMWLKVIKVARFAYGLDEVLGYHRVRNGSISYNKGNLVKYQWYVYRKIEKLSLHKCFFLICSKISQVLFAG